MITRVAYILWILLQASLDKASEVFTPSSVRLESWGLGLWYQEQDPHRVELGERRFSFSHLDSRDTERPDVGATIVPCLSDHFGGHPEWCADECVAL